MDRSIENLFIWNQSRIFVNAIYKGQTWVDTHSAEEIAKELLVSFPDTNLEVLTKVVERYKSIDAWNTTPIMTKESFERLQEVMTNAGELEKVAPYEEIVNNRFAEESIK